MKRITIKDVAKLCGVNASTVSRALNDSEDISILLREKIKKIANEINYQPNLQAVNLRSQRSYIIAMIVPRFSNYFVPSVINGVSNFLNKAGYKLLLLNSEESIDKEIENIKMCIHARVDGILISLVRDTINLDHLSIAKEKNIPVVLYHKVKNQPLYDTCEIDNFNAGALAVKYLKGKKCKNIVGIYGYKLQANSLLNEEGFKKNLPSSVHYQSIFGADTKEIAKAIYIYLKNNKNIDGLFSMSDEALIGAHLALQKIDITQQAKPYIVTISDGKIPYYLNRSIHYIKYDGILLGELASKVLIDRINNGKKEVAQYFLPVTEGNVERSIFE